MADLRTGDCLGVVRHVLVVGLAFGVTALAYLVTRGQLSPKLIAVVAATPWIGAVLSVDSRRLSLGFAPIGIPILILGLPLANATLAGSLAKVLVPAGSMAIAAFYLYVLAPAERRRAISRALPVVLPLLILFGLFGLSYVLSLGVTRASLYVELNLISASAYVVLAGVFCNSVQRVTRGVVLLICVGAIQLPIVVAQAIGIADRLPTSLGLSTAGYGGALVGRVGTGSAAALSRFTGSFGDYELLAEFSTVCLLLCIGLITFRLRPPRSSVCYALAGCVALVGWLTGTRSFVFVALGGLLLLVAIALLQSGPRVARVGRLVLVVALVGIAVAVLVPSSFTAAFWSRFSQPDVSLSGNSFDRGNYYRTSWGLVWAMPSQGYGANMMAVYEQRWGAPITSPHSLYMTTLLTAGFLGLASLVWLLLALLAMPISCALDRRAGRTELRALGAILAVVMFSWVLNEVKIEFLRQSFYVDLMAFLFGLVSSLFWWSRRPENAQLRVGASDDSSMEASDGS